MMPPFSLERNKKLQIIFMTSDMKTAVVFKYRGPATIVVLDSRMAKTTLTVCATSIINDTHFMGMPMKNTGTSAFTALLMAERAPIRCALGSD
mmetsp:Transcript_72900/g.126595  ORF Transcript_72900/g.126595 Transcript_72900/m.126595 type:complete len:93 (+) Transcript_72900:901-1179(+)